MSERLTHGSLFSGIGGPEIAAEIMGWKNVFHCEINPFGRKILDYWFPNSKSYEDITKTDFTEWRGKINVLTGGFPCQPFSCAGQRKGADDDRYLWPEMLRAIREIQPDWVVGENVAGILSMVQPSSETPLGSEETLFGEDNRKRILHRQEYVVETVCNDLEREGYSVQPIVIPACAVGAPHRRDRVFFIAHRADAGSEGMQREWENNILSGGTAPDTDSHRWRDGKNQQVTIAERKGTANIGTFREDGASSDSQCQGSGQIYKEVQSEQSDGHSFDSNGNKRNVAYSSSEGLSTLRFPTSIEKKKRENEDGCSVQPAGNVRRTSFAERWENFPTQSPVCSRDDGIFTITHIRTIQEDNTMDRTDIIMKCLNEGRIITNPDTGDIFSTKIRGYEGQKIKLRGSLCNGYIVHSLKYKGIQKQVRAHQVIWMSVHGEYDKDKFQIDHINRNREDNRIENLRLVTAKENISNQTRYEGEFTKDDKQNMLLLYNEGTMSMREIAELYGCSKSRVHQIISETKSGLDGIAFSKWRQESIKAYGNAIVPQVMYEIFLAIESIEKGK